MTELPRVELRPTPNFGVSAYLHHSGEDAEEYYRIVGEGSTRERSGLEEVRRNAAGAQGGGRDLSFAGTCTSNISMWGADWENVAQVERGEGMY